MNPAARCDDATAPRWHRSNQKRHLVSAISRRPALTPIGIDPGALRAASSLASTALTDPPRSPSSRSRFPARGEGPPWASAETSAHIESAATVIISSMSSVE